MALSALVLIALLSGCGTTQVGLRYQSQQTVSIAGAGSPEIAVGAFIDQRGEPARWLGAIRGGFGNPLKNLETDQPVAQIVQTAFTEGFRARQFKTDPNAAYAVSGVIRKLDCNQVARKEANAEIELIIQHLPSGRLAFSRIYSANNVEGSVLAMDAGVFGSVETLRALTERTLREVVDKALDDSALRNALR
jgi:hypothetical protein